MPEEKPVNVRRRAIRIASELYESLSRRIAAGDLAPGDRLDTEKELSEEHGISRMTIRKVLERLVEQGLIERFSGRGTFVRKGIREENVPSDKLTGLLRIKTYWPTSQADNLNRILSSFRVRYPKIAVELSRSLRDEQIDDLERACLDGYPPDLVHIAGWALPAALSKVAFEPLDTIFDSADLNGLYPELRRVFTFDGRLKAYPFTFSPIMLAYNRGLFDASGVPVPDATWTWERWFDAMDQLAKSKQQPHAVQYGFALSHNANRCGVFMAQGGGREATDWRSAPALTVPGVEEALRSAYELSRRSSVAPAGDVTPEELFAEGYAAMVLCNLCNLRYLTVRKFETDVAPVPAGPRPDTLLVCSGFAMPKAARHHELAVTFLRFVASPEAQTVLRCSGAGIPPRRMIAEDMSLHTEYVHPRSYLSFKASLPHAHVFNRGVSLPTLRAADLLLRKFWAGLIAAREYCEQVDAMLERDG